ncbi:MAG: type II secretion system protein GspK [Candidatus Omnitrophica bacterium]|nr:type II secretion system protein GspK [Candidatus Omnitrophota bacterium]MDD5737368.1 type II secretion system protein GspK [Candidatus Omnitrophota bacterium]
MPRDKKGVALIITVGILALLAMIATSFAYNMMFDLKGAANYVLKMKAKNAAEAGINLSIAYLRQLATSDFNAVPTSACDWAYTSATQPSFDGRDGTAGNSTSGSLGNVGRGHIAVCSLRVTDTNSQININDTNPNLNIVLGNLGTILAVPGWAQSNADSIISGRPAGGYATKEGIVEYMPGANLTAKRANYALIRDFVAANGYIDQYSEDATAPLPTSSTYQSKSPVNINTARREVLRAVLRPLVSTDANASQVAGAIITARTMVSPFRSWNGTAASGGFNAFIDNINPTILTNPQKEAIKNNFNPNKVKQGAYTTDFCFHPGGFYEIISTGTVGIDNNSDGAVEDVKAMQELTAVVRIYSILNYTAKEQFRGEDANYNGVLDSGEDANGNGAIDSPVFQNVTWMNSCPVVSTEGDGVKYPAAGSYTAVSNSLKLGFWDDFSEDNYDTNGDGKAETGFSLWAWSNVTGGASKMEFKECDGDGDWEMYAEGYYPGAGAWLFPKFVLRSDWVFGNRFSLRGFCCPISAGGDGTEDGGRIQFTNSNGSTTYGQLMLRMFGYDYWSGNRDITRPPGTVVWDDQPTANTNAKRGKDYSDTAVYLRLNNSNHRVYRLGDLYGYADEWTDHYNFCTDPTAGPVTFHEEGIDKYHGVMPEIYTLKLAVSPDLSPNYRVWLAVGNINTAEHYNYNIGGYSGFTSCTAPSSNFMAVPLHSSSRAYYDRYNCHASPCPTNLWNINTWYLTLFLNHCDGFWEEIRVVSNTGFYQSPAFTGSLFNGGNPVVWGTGSWTLSTPSTADPGKETCTVQFNTGGGLTAATLNGAIGGTSNSIIYRINLASTDTDCSETPVFEDLTITYLPRASVVYQR